MLIEVHRTTSKKRMQEKQTTIKKDLACTVGNSYLIQKKIVVEEC